MNTNNEEWRQVIGFENRGFPEFIKLYTSYVPREEQGHLLNKMDMLKFIKAQGGIEAMTGPGGYRYPTNLGYLDRDNRWHPNIPAPIEELADATPDPDATVANDVQRPWHGSIQMKVTDWSPLDSGDVMVSWILPDEWRKEDIPVSDSVFVILIEDELEFFNAMVRLQWNDPISPIFYGWIFWDCGWEWSYSQPFPTTYPL